MSKGMHSIGATTRTVPAGASGVSLGPSLEAGKGTAPEDKVLSHPVAKVSGLQSDYSAPPPVHIPPFTESGCVSLSGHRGEERTNP